MKTVAKNVVIALALVVSAAASAQESSSTMLPPNWAGQAYFDLGLHFTHISTDLGSNTNTDFGLTLGGKATYRFAENWSGGPLLNLSLVFDNGGTAVPITAAGVVTFDKMLPVELTGGLGFTVYTGLTGATPVGLALLVQALYPLPSMPNLGIHAQLVENIMTDSTNLVQLVVGAAYKF